MGKGQWAMSNEQWQLAMGNEQMGNEQWAISNG